MRLSTTTTRTKILALPLLLLLLLIVAVAVTNATPLPLSPSPPPSDFSEIEARWAVGQTEVSTCLLHVTCSSFYRTTTTENKNDKSSREIYIYTYTALPPSPSFHHPHINQPTHLPNMHGTMYRVPYLSDPHHSKKSTPARVFERVKLPHGPLLVSLEEEEEEKKLRGLRRQWILGV